MKRKTAAVLSMALAASVMLQACSSKSGETTTQAKETTAAVGTQGTAGTGAYTPGTYTAKAPGYGGDVSVAVTVDENKITDVKIEGGQETAGIGSKAIESMPEAIMKAQSSEVDAVASATVTSTAILTALDDVLNQAMGK